MAQQQEFENRAPWAAIGGILSVALIIGLTGYFLSAGNSPGSATMKALVANASVPPELTPRAMAPPLPPLKDLSAGPERKEAFIDYLSPVVVDVNREVRRRRAALFLIEERLAQGKPLSPEAGQWLDEMVLRYRVQAGDPAEAVQALKARIDIIPVSLALAQAALESNWGTSRFARQANNLFGKWCFTPGCGIVPARRSENATHEVEAYDNVANSVRAYIHHLNSHPVYEPLRERRAEAREKQTLPEGSHLAGGLQHYSARGEVYVDSLRRVIRVNQLEARDTGAAEPAARD
jgi:Bax protein